jgi:hypothetical protein
MKGKANVIKQLLNKHNHMPIPSELNADKFNTFFSQVGIKTAAKLSKNSSHCPNLNLNTCLYKFIFQHVSPACIEKQLNALGEHVSKQDILEMDTKLLCISSKHISSIIAFFINTSFDLGIVLKDWKLSRVTPIYKGKGDRYDENNYRPISVIGHIAKLLEKQVQKQLMKYLIDHDLISSSQSAYLKSHSTITALHNVIENWYDNISDNMYTGICLLDIRKCFDTINHKILLSKLKAYGIDCVQHQWFSSYLQDRAQKVVCHNNTSCESNLTIGVPQGSVLGPILFLLFSNDLPNHTYLGSCNMFADDTLIYITGETVLETEQKLQKCIDNAAKWYADNNLVLNANKSNSLILHPLKKHTDKNNSLNITIGDASIDQTTDADYLGLRIDDSLSWKAQINKICKNIGAKIGELKHIRKSANQEMLLYFYDTFIQPVIDYGITLWSRVPKKDLNKIQKLQNTCARIITQNYDYNTRGLEIIKSLKWMNIRERAEYFTCILLFKCLYNLTPLYLQNEIFFKKDLCLRKSERFKYDVYIPPFISNFKDNSFFIQGGKMWNNLPPNLKSIEQLA